MVLKLDKLTRPMIPLKIAVSTTTTKKIIEEVIKRRGAMLVPENVGMYSRPTPLAPKTPDVSRKFYPLTASAGGAAAAAHEGGALADPSAPTPTSTRWALVTP
jgi:hypothetical protein